jgi:hypothetical protein
MRVTICPPAEKTNRSPAFDRYAFENRRTRPNPESGLDFAGMQHLHTLRIPDARKGRRLAVPAWALSDTKLAEVCVLYLEQRFQAKDCSGDLKARLQRCREAAALTAKGTKARLERWIRNYRAINNARFHEADESVYTKLFLSTLRAESSAKLLAEISKQATNLDSEVMMLERAPEIALSVLYLYFRLGYNSPSISESLTITPVAARQIIHRASQRAVRKVSRTRLTKEQISELRRLHHAGTPTPQLAAKFGIARDTARRIILRENKKGSK